MSVVFEGIDMPTACCFADGEHSVFAHMEYCKFYNICKQRDTVKNNYKPDDCPVKLLEQEPTTKNNLGVDNQNIRLIDANALIKRLLPKHFDWWGEDEQEQDDFSKGNNSMLDEVIEAIEEFPSVTPQEPCDKCEVGNPCLYCKHEFEPQESEDNNVSV